jgi:glycosyltransferase involved in cell wall biosynthesis
VGNFTLQDAKNLKEFTMRIAIHGSELDAERIDGTRVYISEMLNRFADFASDDEFLIYHQNNFNSIIAPPQKNNYIIKKLAYAPLWTQTRFAFDLRKERPDVVWMPLHNLPRLRSKKTKFVVTIHDLAFKIFPETFLNKDVKKLNFLTDYAVKNADKIIAVSKATRRDLLLFYPDLKKDKIIVIHHGFDVGLWQKQYDKNVIQNILTSYDVASNKYLIHVGAIQPRKNIKVLVDAFTGIKEKYQDMKLILIGGNGWLWEDIRKYVKMSKYSKDIIFTGNISFSKVVILVQNAKVFVFPSLYEGFGIAGLEAIAAGTSIIAANNSSLPEVLGNAALYFDAKSSRECGAKILQIMENKELKQQLIINGLKRVDKFSWDECAKKTLRVLRE